jgi:hypothetical protein
MGSTWVVDMSHFDYRDEEVHKFPAKALNLWGYFGLIIEATLSKPSPGHSTGIPCRRRPGRAPCSGVIESELHPDGNKLRWWCPICADNGTISNWEGTRWAPSQRPFVISIPKSGELFGPKQTQGLRILAPECIQGTIEWDEEKDGEIPKIVTNKKVYTWEELGRELMTYEGFRISIDIG